MKSAKLRAALSKWGLVVLIILITGFIACLIVYPHQSFEASLEGLRVWWTIVLPASLPFFIGSQILIGLGAVHLLSVILAPLMRPLFNVPGAGAFALAMGLSSGNPLGAAITAELRKKDLCSKTEGERLISFTNNANLLFMGGAVAVGIFKRPELGFIFVLTHYIATFFTALVYRFYKYNEVSLQPPPRNNEGYFLNAIKSLQKARKEDGRSFSKILGDSVSKSVSTLLVIGGFIVLFSVLNTILAVSGLLTLAQNLISPGLDLFGFDPSLGTPLISSFFEITNGIKMISGSTAPLEQQILVTCSVISWSGLSIQTQVASMIADTDLSIIPYLFSRIVHSILSFIVASVIINYTSLIEYLNLTKPAFASGTNIASNWLESFSIGFNQFFLLCILLFLLTLITACFSLIKKIITETQKYSR